MPYKEYSRYMNDRSQMTPEGRAIHAESVRQSNAIKQFPKKVVKKVVKKIKSGVKKVLRYTQ